MFKTRNDSLSFSCFTTSHWTLKLTICILSQLDLVWLRLQAHLHLYVGNTEDWAKLQPRRPTNSRKEMGRIWVPCDAGSSTSAFGGAESIYLQVPTFGAGCSVFRLALVILSINFSYFPNLPDLSCCGSSRIWGVSQTDAGYMTMKKTHELHIWDSTCQKSVRWHFEDMFADFLMSCFWFPFVKVCPSHGVVFAIFCPSLQSLHSFNISFYVFIHLWSSTPFLVSFWSTPHPVTVTIPY